MLNITVSCFVSTYHQSIHWIDISKVQYRKLQWFFAEILPISSFIEMKIHHILWIKSLLYCCRLTAIYYAILDCVMMSINLAILKTKWDEHMPDIIFTSLESVTWSCVLDIELSLLVSTNFLVCPSCHITVQYGSWSWWIKGCRRWATNHHTITPE